MKRSVPMVLWTVVLAGAFACDTSDEASESAPPPEDAGACFCVDPWSGATRCCIAMPDADTCKASVSECNAWFMANTDCASISGYRSCATR